MSPLRVLIGKDERQPLSFNVCASSVFRHATKPVSVMPIGPDWIPGFRRNGLTTFTFRRYLAPYLCGYSGISVFMDGDIVVRADVNELADIALRDPHKAVFVAKHVARFEWPAVMVFNNDLCRKLTPEYLNDPNSAPQSLEWANEIGELPREWHQCVGYEPHNEDAKLIHFTAGISCWPETKECPHSDKWWDEFKYANSTVSWNDLMGNSVHRDLVLSGRLTNLGQRSRAN